MPRFFTGDELGNIKSLRYMPDNEIKSELKTVHDKSTTGKITGVQALSIASLPSSNTRLLAAAYSNGFCSAFALKDHDELALLGEWKESRFKPDHTFVGLSVSERGIYSCTSGGALRLASLSQDETSTHPKLASLPTRLCDWRLSSNQETFAYAGDEVELSVWNTEQAFAPPSTETRNKDTKKRKQTDVLFPGEIWRAKNVPNDYLGLRQPVHIASIAYLSASSTASYQHLLTGTQLGDIRRYDTRAARRPMTEWKGIGKLGGVKTVEKGYSEHEVFVSDKGCNLFSLDLRNGGVLCGYKGIAGAVTSIAPSPTYVASTALDRFSRVHSTSQPPPQAGQQVEKKGEVISKVYMQSTPTVVVWDGDSTVDHQAITETEDDSEGEDVWGGMEDADDSDVDEERKQIHKKARTT